MRVRSDAVQLSGLEYRFSHQHEESTHVIRARYVELAVHAPPLYRGTDNPVWARMLIDPTTVCILVVMVLTMEQHASAVAEVVQYIQRFFPQYQESPVTTQV